MIDACCYVITEALGPQPHPIFAKYTGPVGRSI